MIVRRVERAANARRIGVVLGLVLLCGASLPATAVAASYPPDTMLTRVPTPAGAARPAYLTPVLDESFGTEITRISDPGAFGQPRERVIRHAYAKNEPWNADGSLLMLDWRHPAPLLDGHTFAFLGLVRQPSEAIWLNTDPRLTIGVAGNRLVEWNMVADRRATVLHRFGGYRRIDLGAGEGNLSADDRYAALFGILPGRRVDLLVYDRERDRVFARRRFENATVGDGEKTFNNVTMAQSGKFVVVEFNRHGYGARRGIVAYRTGLQHPVGLSANGGSHFDACRDVAGDDVIVAGADRSATLVAVRLADGSRTTLLPPGPLSDGVHISCRNVRRRGWAYLSQFGNRGSPWATNYDEVFAVRLDGSATVERFAHEHHSHHATYEREAHAVPSRDGSQVLFASDWERPRGPVLAYVAGRP